jgi:predicted GNAT family N-acyltransferase
MPLLVTLATTPEDIAICMAIRHEVFINEQGFHPSIEIDPKDKLPTTRHLLGKDTDQDKYVATARCLLTPDLRKAKVGRVAVLKECRGKSFGVAMMKGIEEVLTHEVDTFMLSSQYDKREFYEKCGYEYLNEEVYLEEGVEHCMMVKKIKA